MLLEGLFVYSKPSARMRSEGYGSWFVCVCLSTRLRGGPLAIPAVSELRELEKEKGDFPETTAFESDKLAGSRTALRGPTHQLRTLARSDLDLIRLLCVPWRHKKPQRRACIDSRMLSTTVASPCQTLSELLY